MSQQGERPTRDDDWWNRLYDESAPDAGPDGSRDSLDDRFNSASGTVSSGSAGSGAVGSAAADASPSASSGAEDSETAGPPPAASDVVGPDLTGSDVTGPDSAGSGVTGPHPAGFTPADSDVADRNPAGLPRAERAAPPAAPSASPRPRAPWEPPETPPAPRKPAAWWETVPAAPPPPTAPAPLPDLPPGWTEGAPPDPAGAAHPAEERRPAPLTAPPDPPRAAAREPRAPQGVRTPTVETPAPPAVAPDEQFGPPKTAPPEQFAPVPRPRTGHVGDGPPTYDAEPTALPAARPDELDDLVADTVLDGARYGAYLLRASSSRGDSARYRGEPRRDALLTARFGTGENALVLVAVASGARTSERAHLAAADACHWIGGAIGRSHVRLAEDIRAGRRGDLKSGLHRLTDRSYGMLRARAAELGAEPEEYTASLRCLLLSADPACRTRVFFGIGHGGLFRLRGGVWQDIEPAVPDAGAVYGEPVVGFGSAPAETPQGDRLTMDLNTVEPARPYIDPPAPPGEPFRFRASVARPGDTLLLCSGGLAEPLRGEAALAKELAERWARPEPPGLAAFLADVTLRVKGYADDRTAVAVWEA
ncbi:protein phosphatase 2C domain-containing protein [Streptomyces violascens]|uniref:protein phosphatase 2C domain-containing protein n=1 Tax=Streptomyces violascens TaxID=67381 RepID=UPI00365D7C9F